MRSPVPFWILLGLIAFTGCEKKEAAFPTFDREREKAFEEIKQKMAEKAKIVSEDARSLLPATSKEQLAQAYAIAFDAGDITAIEQMAHLEFVQDQEREPVAKLGLYLARDRHLEEFTFVPITDEEKSEYATLMPIATAKIYITPTTRYGRPVLLRVPVVEVDGKIYFYLYEPSADENLQAEQADQAVKEVGHDRN